MYCLRERSFQTDDPVLFKVPSGSMFFPADRSAAKYFAERGSYEDSLIQWAKSFLDPSTVFVDIGAHVGTYSLGLATHCAGVHSFECFPKTFNYLCANIAARELDLKITPHRTALGNKDGKVVYTLRSKDGASNTCLSSYTGNVDSTLDVPVTTLDSFNLTNVGLIKIDVEGLEKDVLEGAQDTLRRNKYPRILFESWRESRSSEGFPAKELRDSLFQYLNDIGYSIRNINGWDEMFIADYTGTDSTTK
jgi:FkbM family methyltransferase